MGRCLGRRHWRVRAGRGPLARVGGSSDLDLDRLGSSFRDHLRRRFVVIGIACRWARGTMRVTYMGVRVSDAADCASQHLCLELTARRCLSRFFSFLLNLLAPDVAGMSDAMAGALSRMLWRVSEPVSRPEGTPNCRSCPLRTVVLAGMKIVFLKYGKCCHAVLVQHLHELLHRPFRASTSRPGRLRPS